MNKKNSKILRALKNAMQAETDGHYFYKMAAGKTKDIKGRETLLTLAKDELEHYKFLRAQYDSLLETGKPTKDVTLATPKARTKASRIFSNDFKNRIKRAHYEMSALSIAIGLELSSINFYRQEAREAGDPILREFYEKLADWEVTHHQILVREQSRLQEDYWIENRFYPF
jgi:rubrerythrin